MILTGDFPADPTTGTGNRNGILQAAPPGLPKAMLGSGPGTA
ncbi:hypothetical protein METH_01355 [Leisingera methylohalidivorans DSM 14336]|uniref:Uncharacterized protein n=1 Tax=Leisingera methylohalidivorans DSM 14336 TaxID=999552 RepID=V9W0Y7_9RHOB|nr:hypothetical protein METH_01355 [Leisingera methylohalidivorans DSM 14336]